MSSPLLEPRLVTQLGRHQLRPRRRVVGRYQGGHRSARLGTSVEFADVREYVPGDDPRRIDLSASRRHRRLQVTLTEAEDDATAHVVLDASASMRAGKWRAAAGLVAGLALLGARDGVRLWTVGRGDGVDRVGGGHARGQSAIATATRLLADAMPEEAQGSTGRPDLAATVRRAARIRTRGPLILVSDLLFDGWPEAVVAAGAGPRDALVLQVLARDELAPDLVDDLRLVDVETGLEVEVAGHEPARAAYADVLAAHLADVAANAARVGASHLVVAEDADPATVLLRDLAALGFVR